MNWIKANKFLAGLLAVAVLGLGIFGYLIYGAMDQASTATDEFSKQATEYKRLQALPTYPNQGNLKKLEEQRKEHQDRIDALQARLAGMEGPIDPQLGPVPFQDRLRQSVSDYEKKAAQAGLKLHQKEGDKASDKFYMGMGRYQATPPRPEAAPLLGRELKAMEFIMDALMEARVSELTEEPDREEFPEENGNPPKATPPPKPGVKNAAPVELVKKHAIGISVLTDQLPLQKFLNAIASAKVNFLVIRSVSVTNEKVTGPTRGEAPGAVATGNTPPPATDPGPPVAAGSPAAGAAADKPAPTGISYIVGQEKVRATVIIELTDFAPVASNKPAVKKPGQPNPRPAAAPAAAPAPAPTATPTHP